MKKKVACLLIAALVAMVNLKAQVIVLSESFENGIPAGWTQENVVGNQAWATETAPKDALAYPDGAVSGFGRAALRNTTGESKGYKTRLISPVMNLDTVFQPILRYYHAQAKWTADFDTLRVYYRNVIPEAGKDAGWKLLQEFTRPIQKWTKEMVDLPRVSATYQICFEGSENLGRGIVLDSVVVRSKPECTTPHDLAVTNMHKNSVTLNWLASFDAVDFQIVVAEVGKEFDIDTLDLAAAKRDGLILKDTTVSGVESSVNLNGLAGNTHYAAFVRSLCEIENSDWGVDTFYMKSIESVPYYTNFNVAKTSSVSQDRDWTYGSNLTIKTPYINSNQTESTAQNHARTGYALCFAGKTTPGSGADIAANSYAYAATPMLEVADISKCQVRFWASLGTHGCLATDARAIIVGVMDDPEDITSFVAVDTIRLWKYATYEQQIVSLASYKGEGRYVAFMSRFDMPNQFYIDDIAIEEAPAVPTVTSIQAAPAVTEATLTWENVASEYKVLVAKVAEDTVANIKDADIVVSPVSVTKNSYTAMKLEPGSTYYAYVQAKDGVWSAPKAFTTSWARTLPMMFGFEAAETYKEGSIAYPTHVAVFATDKDANRPKIQTGKYYHLGKQALSCQQEVGREAWIVFPYIDTVITGVEMSFYLRANSTTYKNTAVAVGVMTDPSDINTFVEVARFASAVTTYAECYTDFQSYTGDGKYIAIRWAINPAGGASSSYSLKSYPVIDDVTIKGLSSCVTPKVSFTDITPHKATIQWEARNMTKFDILIDSVNTKSNEQLNIAFEAVANKKQSAGILYHATVENANTYTLEDDTIRWGRTVYVYVRSVCDDGQFSYWSKAATLTLGVPDAIELPYTENFDYWGTGVGTMAAGWDVISNDAFPYMNTSKTSTKPVVTYIYATLQSDVPGRAGRLVAPVLNIDDLNKLKISFKAWHEDTYSGYDSLRIGVLSGPADSTGVITWMDTIGIPKTGKFDQYALSFHNWTASMGNRVVFQLYFSGTAKKKVRLDDITFEHMVNIAPFAFETSDATENQVTISWQGESQRGWSRILTTKELNPDKMTKADSAAVIIRDSITTNPVTIKNLTPQTGYYLYLRALDGTTWSEGFNFYTSCVKLDPKAAYYKMDFEGIIKNTATAVTKYKDSRFPECWTRHGGDEADNDPSYTPFIYQYKKGTTIKDDSYVHSGLAAAYIYANSTASPAWFATPELDAKMANVTVSFWVKASQNAYPLLIGVMKNPDDWSTFTKLMEYKPTHKYWAQVDCNLGNHGYRDGMGNYIVFATPASIVSGGAPAYYVDDIEITESACKSPYPVLSGLATTSVRLAYASDPEDMRMLLMTDSTFISDSLNAPDNAHYLAKVKAYPTFVKDSIILQLVGIPLFNLKGNTPYSVALQTQCEEGTSKWVVTSFHTLCPYKTVAEMGTITFEGEGFDADESAGSSDSHMIDTLGCWINGKKGDLNLLNVPYVGQGDAAPAGKAFLRFRTGTKSDANSGYVIMPGIEIEDISQLQMQFLGRALDSYSYSSNPSLELLDLSKVAGSIIVGVISDPSDIGSFVAVDTVTFEDNAVHTALVRFDKYKGKDGVKGKHVMFLSEFDRDNYFLVDDIRFEIIPACAQPVAIKVTDVDASSATVSWQGNSAKYRVMVTTEKLADDKLEKYKNYATNDTVTASSCQITNLTGAKTHYVYVKSLCGEEGSWCLEGVRFKTACPAVMPSLYIEDFDDYVDKATPNCWTSFYNGKMDDSNGYPHADGAAAYGGSTSGLAWYIPNGRNIKTTDYAVPEKRATIATLPVADISKVSVSFKLASAAKNTKPNAILLGYATDVSCLDSLLKTVQYVDTVYTPNGSTEWLEYNRNMEDCIGKNVHIVMAFYYSGGYYYEMYMDDFTVEVNPTCFAPKGAKVDAISTDTAVVTIAPYALTDNRWNIMCVSTDETDTVYATATDTVCVVKGLKHSTTYNLYVRTDCGGGDVSAWCRKNLSFRTLYKIREGQFYGFETKEGVETKSHILNGRSESYTIHPSLYAYGSVSRFMPTQLIDSNATRTGSGVMRLMVYNEYGKNAYMALPEIEGAGDLQLRFDMRIMDPITVDSALYESGTTYPYTTLEIGTIDHNYNWDSYKPVYSYQSSQYEYAERITNKKNRMYDQIVVPLPAADLEGRYLVINNPMEIYSEVYIDNVRLEKKQDYQTPVISQSSITPDSLTIGWEANGSTEWNVYLTNSVDAFPVDSALEANIVKKANVKTNTYTFTDLTPNTKYYAYVQVANVSGLGATSVRRIFRTPLEKMTADTIITFEGTYGKDLVVRFDSTLMLDKSYLERRAGDSIYVMPMGWYAGNDASSGRLYTPWARPNNYDATGTDEDNSIRVAFQGERALQLYNDENGRLGAYAAMPEIDADYDTLQVNFYARPFHEEDGEISDMHNAPLIFGTMTDPNQPNTFVGLDTLYFAYSEYEDGQDATKLQDNGWQKMFTRLTGATGRYAAFALPSGSDAWYIDNISFSEHTCLAPNGLKALDVTAHTAQIVWRPYDKGVPCVLQIAKTGNFGSNDIVLSDTLTTETTKLVTGLLGTTTYYYRLRQVCGATDMSPWSAIKSFTTECSEIDGSFSTGFEKDDEHLEGDGYKDYYPQCWYRGSTGQGRVYGTPATLVESSWGWSSRNTTATNLSHKWAWKLEAQANKDASQADYNYDQWFAMPALQHVDVDTLQLVFYALAGEYDPDEQVIYTSYCAARYLRNVVVGVMTDPNDLSTFTPLDTCVYTRDSLTESTSATPENEFMFQRFEVPLKGMKGHGEYIAFRTNTADWLAAHPETSMSRILDQIYIDDISFAKLNECATPINLVVSDITLDGAKLTWKGDEGAQWILNVSTDPTFSNFGASVIKDSVVSAMEVVLSGLQPVTTYYWNVKQMCTAAMISAESQTARFNTLHQPMYNEFFLDNVKTPFEWERSVTRASDIFAGGTMVKDNSTPYEFDSWLRNANTDNVAIEGPHMIAPLTNCSDSVPDPKKTYNVKRQAWFMSPNIALGSENAAWLTFDVAMTYYYKGKAAEQTGWDDQFMVVISDDGGKTWKRENATIWNNETTNDPADEHYVYGTGDYVLNNLPAKAPMDEPVYIDLSKYKGKTIKIGFYVESTVFNAHNCLRLGNVHINYYNQLTETQSACQFTDVESKDGRFFIDGDNAQVGEMTFNKFQLASESSAETLITPFDTLYTFKVTYSEAPQTVINKTICEGEETGAEWGFANRSVSGTYKRKLTSAVTGCDSITTLNLTVIPRQYSTETVTICSGTSYTFNGVEYSKTCVHIDTLTSVITGCDSITKLELTVNPPITAKVNAYTCTGAPFYFTERYPALTLSGTYMDTVRTAEGCDSIVTLTLTVADKIEISVYDTICQGESFTFEGKEYSETGIYPAQFQSVAGCDSIRTLYLTVGQLYKDTIHASICQGGIYSENGFSETEAGLYSLTKTSIFGCDSVVVLNLSVTDLDTIRVDTLIQVADLPYFYPNTQITYPLSTEPGTYTDTIFVKGKDAQCDYVLIHRLTVEGGQGVNDNVIGSITLQPNVINVGESVVATGNFVGQNVTVDVYDMVGHCVSHEQISSQSVRIDAFHVAGLYTIRITDEQGNPFIGRVIVK